MRRRRGCRPGESCGRAGWTGSTSTSEHSRRGNDMQTAQDQQVLITRIFDAPRDVVFRAWTDPDQVAQWFGPDGFEAPRETVEIDLRVGGGVAPGRGGAEDAGA